MNNKIFWNKVMPACVAGYAWGEALGNLKSEGEWVKGLKAKLVAMDEAEFDLFLAGMVMEAAKKQVMGKDLTEKVEMFKELRG